MLRVFSLALLVALVVGHSSGSSGQEKHGHGHGHHPPPHGHGNGHGRPHGHGNGHHGGQSHGHGHHGGKHAKNEPAVHYTTNENLDLSKVSEHALKQSFKEWKKDFDKTYASPAEESIKFATYLSNWEMILSFNSRANETWKMGMNQFSDLTSEEFKAYIHGGRGGSCMKGLKKVWRERKAVSGGEKANPASVDWTTKGVVTPVKNQGQCGSCWAFSTTGSLECQTAIKTGKLVSLSEQQLVDCSGSYGNQGCNGGLMDDAFKYIKSEGGLCTESSYRYTAKDGTCKAASCGQKYDPIKGFTDVTHNSAPSLETAVAQGCVSVAIEADQSAFQFYKSGILSGRCGTRLDHGVLVVGYGEEGGKKYWKVKNSWGATWGEKGYVRMCKECGKDLGRGECGILEQPSYPDV